MRVLLFFIFVILLITCKYKEAEHLYPFKELNKWGVMDESGRELLSPVFDSIAPFSEETAVVYKGNKCGCIDSRFKFIIPLVFDGCDAFHNGISVVRNINAYEYESDFSDSIFVFSRKGKLLFTSTVDSFSQIFSNGLALSSSGDDDPINYINSSGEVAIRTKFIHGSHFKNGYATLWSDTKSILIDSTGRTIRAFKQSLIDNPSDGLIRVIPINTDTTYYYNMLNLHETKPLLALNNKDRYFASFINGFAHVFNRVDNSHGFINKRGELVIQGNYEAVKDFYGGLVAVQKNGKWGFLDQKGMVAIPFQFDNVIVDFTTPLAMVRSGNETFWINKHGEKIFPKTK